MFAKLLYSLEGVLERFIVLFSRLSAVEVAINLLLVVAAYKLPNAIYGPITREAVPVVLC